MRIAALIALLMLSSAAFAANDYSKPIVWGKGVPTFEVDDYNDLPTAYAACKTAGGGNVALPRGRTTIAITDSTVSPYLDATGVDNGAGSFKGVCAITGYGAGDYQNNNAVETNGGSELYVTNLDDMVSANTTTVTGSHSDSVTTITVGDTTGFPAENGMIQIGTETIYYTGTTGTTFTGATRGYNGTTAAAYSGSEAVSGEEYFILSSGEGQLMRDFSIVVTASDLYTVSHAIQVKTGSGTIIENVTMRNNSGDTGYGLELEDSEKSSIRNVKIENFYTPMVLGNGRAGGQTNNATAIYSSTFRSAVVGMLIEGSTTTAQNGCAAAIPISNIVFEGNSEAGLKFGVNSKCSVVDHGSHYEGAAGSTQIDLGSTNLASIKKFGGVFNAAADLDISKTGSLGVGEGPSLIVGVEYHNDSTVTAGTVLYINSHLGSGGTALDGTTDPEVIFTDAIDAENMDLTDDYTWTGAHDFTGGTSVNLPDETTDPCGSDPEGSIFYNDTSNYYCYCDGTNDVQLHDPATACF